MIKDINISYCDSLFKYNRNFTSEVIVGNLKIGGKNPIVIQSMTTTNTNDTDATAEQAIKIFDAGGEMIRITTQGQLEAANLGIIKEMISQKGYIIPLVADIHFNPSAAILAAKFADKVRINPGNFSDISKLQPFIETCKQHGTAIRIGVNHGSLSERIMSKFGNTPEGMVESCMEYLRICHNEGYDKIVLSLKSSNTRVMVQAVRLLVATMKQENMNYPLHLGVTEAGSGEDGRIKSAVGIGALLADGIGDTIRVSLTEPPENEIPVAEILVNHFISMENHATIEPVQCSSYTPYIYVKRNSHQVHLFGGLNFPLVVADLRGVKSNNNFTNIPDAVISDYPISFNSLEMNNIIQIVPAKNSSTKDESELLYLYEKSEISNIATTKPVVLQLNYTDLDNETIDFLKKKNEVIILLTTDNKNGACEQRAFFMKMNNLGLTHPVIIHRKYETDNVDIFTIKSAADTGLLFLDGFGDGISLSAQMIDIDVLIDTHFSILQASRVRFSKTEYISCPGCGRTLFDLQATEKKVKEHTSHLKGLKIAVMGCIVNGPGEMADADYGYVGAAAGKVSLFKNRELVAKNIPEKDAVEKLIELIKKNGDWKK